jgi:hypothetical protein
MTHRKPTQQVRKGVGRAKNGGTPLVKTVAPPSLMDDELESDDESNTKEEDLVYLCRELQEQVRNLEEENRELHTEVGEMKERAARNTSDMLGRAQVQHYETDLRTHRRINALVLEKLFRFKKFIISQKELDDFTGDSSIGMLVMNMLKVEKPDRLPFWNAYKESVADAIANRRTTITNDLKKVVMSK